MSDIQLEEKSNRTHKEYESVELSENVSIEAIVDIADELISVAGGVAKGDNRLGYFNLSSNEGKMIVNLSIGNLKCNTVREVVSAIATVILQLMPEEVTEEQ